jgi:hypothetical protein
LITAETPILQLKIAHSKSEGTFIMTPNEENNVAARRDFLAKCGKFAAVTPIVMTGMLAASKQNFAVAVSGGNGGGGNGNNGYGNGGGDGIPGKSGGKGGGKGKGGPINDRDR